MEIYVSTDIESDGPIPGPHSMLSLGSVAFTKDGKEISDFSVNLELLPDAKPDPDTAEFWKQHPEAYALTRVNPEYPAAAMLRYRAWLENLPGQPVFVAYPAGFDFTFVYWYLVKFTGHSPFSFSALDIKTYAMSLLNCDYKAATKRNWPRSWRSRLPHTHQALSDAREQGQSFINMLKYRKSK